MDIAMGPSGIYHSPFESPFTVLQDENVEQFWRDDDIANTTRKASGQLNHGIALSAINRSLEAMNLRGEDGGAGWSVTDSCH